jgi:hypothetical protein
MTESSQITEPMTVKRLWYKIKHEIETAKEPIRKMDAQIDELQKKRRKIEQDVDEKHKTLIEGQKIIDRFDLIFNNPNSSEFVIFFDDGKDNEIFFEVCHCIKNGLNIEEWLIDNDHEFEDDAIEAALGILNSLSLAEIDRIKGLQWEHGKMTFEFKSDRYCQGDSDGERDYHFRDCDVDIPNVVFNPLHENGGNTDVYGWYSHDEDWVHSHSAPCNTKGYGDSDGLYDVCRFSKEVVCFTVPNVESKEKEKDKQ